MEKVPFRDCTGEGVEEVPFRDCTGEGVEDRVPFRDCTGEGVEEVPFRTWDLGPASTTPEIIQHCKQVSKSQYMWRFLMHISTDLHRIVCMVLLAVQIGSGKVWAHGVRVV